MGRSYDEFATGVTKQATLPEGALSLGLAGTAPGLVLETGGSAVVVVLPGPPRELQRLWPRALETAPVRRILERAPERGRAVLRFFGTPESAVAQALADAGGEAEGVEATICAREFEIHVDLVFDPEARERAEALAAALRAELGRYLFSEDGRSIAEHRPRPLPSPRPHARGCGVVHRRPRRGSPDRGRGSERRLSRKCRRVCERREGAASSASPPSSSSGSGRSPPRSRRRWPQACGTPRRRRRRRHHRDRRAGWRHRGEAGRSRLRARSRTGRREGTPHRPARRPGDGAGPRHRCRAPSRAHGVGESTHTRVSRAASVTRDESPAAGDEKLRLFLALELPDLVTTALREWGERHLVGARAVESFHVTLAFLGARPARELEGILASLRESAAESAAIELEPLRYRETRAVGMLVLADVGGEASRLASRLQDTVGATRRVRARVASVAPARHGRALPGASAPVSAPARDRALRSVRRRCFPFTSAPVRGALRGTRVVFVGSNELGRMTA